MTFHGLSFSIGFGSGFASGFAGGFLARELTKGATVNVRPLAKSVTKGAILLFEKLKETLALAGESFEDLLAEAKSELAHEVPGTATEGGIPKEAPTPRTAARKSREREPAEMPLRETSERTQG